MTIGDNIKKVRKSRKITQHELAKETGLSRSYIGDLENDRYNPSTKTLDMLAKKLDVSALFLNTGDNSYIDLKYGQSVGNYIDEQLTRLEEQAKKNFKERAKVADDFNFEEFKNTFERFRLAVEHKKNITYEDGTPVDRQDAAFLLDLCGQLERVNPKDIDAEDRQDLLGTIAMLLANNRDINISDLHQDLFNRDVIKRSD